MQPSKFTSARTLVLAALALCVSVMLGSMFVAKEQGPPGVVAQPAELNYTASKNVNIAATSAALLVVGLACLGALHARSPSGLSRALLQSVNIQRLAKYAGVFRGVMPKKSQYTTTRLRSV